MDTNTNPHRPGVMARAIPYIMVVFLVLGTAGVVGPMLGPEPVLTGVSLVQHDLLTIAGAMEAYRTDLGAWPHPGAVRNAAPIPCAAFLGAFLCLTEDPGAFSSWQGPYLPDHAPTFDGQNRRDVLIDPWGNGYQVYRFMAEDQQGIAAERICVLSPGPDNTLDTSPQQMAAGLPAGDDMLVLLR